MSWHCEEEDSPDEPDFHVSLPGLLPSFLQAAGPRLAALTTIKLSGQAAFSQADAFALADACPSLSRLALSSITVLGPAFAPLSHHTNLRALALDSATAPGRTAAIVAASLSRLSHLTELSASVEPGQPCGFDLEEVLPHLTGLSSLRLLRVRLSRRVPLDNGVFSHLAALTALTSLECQCAQSPGAVSSERLRPADLAPLTHSKLAHLSLPGAALNTGSIELLASLPSLRALSADALDPGRDLGGLACGWTALTLRRVDAPQHLAWLPLSALEALNITTHTITWSLDPTCGEFAAVLGRAAQLLAHVSPSAAISTAAAAAPAPRPLRLLLDWDRPAVEPLCVAAALAALAPLQRQRHVSLALGRRWVASAALAKQLEDRLPALQLLGVHASTPAFPSFAAAIGTKFRKLRELTVLDAEPAPRTSQAALMALACLRASVRLPLTIWVADCVSMTQRGLFNSMLRSIGSRHGVSFMLAAAHED